MAYICRNIDNASKLKSWPDVMFSPLLENYINQLADIHCIHPDSLAIVLLNCVASTTEFSYVLRANSIDKKIPTNLYNIIVARSSYGKSDMTKLLRDTLKCVAFHRPTKFVSGNQGAISNQVNPSLDEMSKAGLMTGLDDCCRTLICDEADMTFVDLGLFLSNNSSRASIEMNCRGLIMILFDRINHAYIRQLAGRSVSVQRSKLNIMGCSTGDIISNMIIRKKCGACFDPMIGRFIFWPLDGPIIPDKLTHQQIDNNLFASLNQFVVILSFVENVIFSFEDNAITEMIEWGNNCKHRSFDERNSDECLSARLGKAVQHAYRMASFLQTIEIGFGICQEYMEHYGNFPANGIIDDNFIDNVKDLYHIKYPDQFRLHAPDSFRVSKDVALRAIDLISCNMRQFMLLFDGTYAPKVSSVGRQVIVISPDKQQLPSAYESSVEHKQAVTLKQTQRRIENSNNVATAVLLFPSICFTMKQLHRSTTIHNNSGGGILKEVLKKLVDTDILGICPRGIKHSSRTTSVYIKLLPPTNDTDAEDQFQTALSEYSYKEQPVSFDLYKNSCEYISLEAIGTVQEDVYEILRRPEYGDRDLSVLFNLPKTNSQKIESSNSQTLFETSENDREEENVLNMLSSYMDPSDTCSSILHLQVQENIFEHVNSHHQEPDENCNHPNASDGVQVINSKNMITGDINGDDLNIVNTANSEKDINLNSFCINDEEQKNNSENTCLTEGELPDSYNNSFSSPAAWRTRSKTKVQNEKLDKTGWFI